MAKFDFFEVVRVRDSDRIREFGIAGCVGAVLGMSEEEGAECGYAVSLDDGDGWDLMEHELESTGEYRQESDYYTGESIRVSQDGELLEVNLFDEDDGQAEGSAPSG